MTPKIEVIAEFTNTTNNPIFKCRQHKVVIPNGLIYKAGSYFNYYCTTKCFEDYYKYSLHPEKYKTLCYWCNHRKLKAKTVKRIETSDVYIGDRNNSEEYENLVLSLKNLDRKNTKRVIFRGHTVTFYLTPLNICQDCLGDAPLGTTIRLKNKFSKVDIYISSTESFAKFKCHACRKSSVRTDIIKVKKRGVGVGVCDETCANIYLLQKNI